MRCVRCSASAASPCSRASTAGTAPSAQHEVGHLARIAAIDAALARHPGLFVTGSGFRGVGIPDCVADGRKTAAQVDDLLKKQDMVTETTEIRRSSR